MSMRHWYGARGSSLSKILSLLLGKKYPGTATLGEGGPPDLSLSRWLPGVPE